MAKGKGKGRKAKAGQESSIQDGKYRLLFESSSDAIMLLDRERFFDCNKATLEMFGLIKEEFIKLHPSEISPPKQANGKNSREEADRRISEAYEKGINRFEWIHRRSNGKEFPCTVWLTKFPLEGRMVLQATVREICHSEEAHMDLEAHRLKLQLLLDEKSIGMKKEVSERKKAESEVKRLIKAVEGSFDAIVLLDTDLNIVYANKAFCELAEIETHDQKNRNVGEFLPAHSALRVANITGKAMDGIDSQQFEIEVCTSLGKKKWVEIAGSTLYNEGGEPEGYLAVINDITERRDMVRSLQESEKEMRTLKERLDYVLGATNTGFDIIDEHFNVVYVDPAWAKSLGDYTGRKCYDYFMGTNSMCEGCAIPSAIKTGQKVISEEYLQKERRYIEVHTIPVKDEDGKVLAAEFNIDITQRKQAERILRESEEKYRTLMESANDAIFLADAKTGVLIDANEKACKLTGRTRYELIGMHQTKLHPEEELKKYDKIFKKHVKDGNAIEAGIFVQHKDGRRVPISISSSVFEITGLLVNQGIFHDLTEQIAAEKALRESDEKIRSIFTSMEDIVFGFDKNGVFTSCQSPNNSILYVPPEMFLGKKYSEILPPHLTKLIDRGFRRNMKHQALDFEYPLDLEGQERWFSAKLTPLYSDGEFNGSVAVVRDVTEKKTTEKALQASEQVYKSLYESTMALGETGDIQRIMEVIAEQARNMLEGECSTIYLWDDKKELLMPYYSNAKSEKDKFMAFEMPLGTGLTGSVAKNAEGAYANFNDPNARRGYVPGTKSTKDHLQSIIAEPMLNEGRLLGVINVIAQERIFNDEALTKLRVLAKQATIAYLHAKNLDELLKSEERFRKMGDSMHDGLIIVEDGMATYINESATEIYGYPPEEMKTKTHLDLVIPEDRDQLRQVLESFRDSGRMPGEIEFWIQRKDGSRRYIRTRTSTMSEGKKRSQFIITTDITERKQAEDENKRKLMKYLLDDGRIYLIKEFKHTMTLEAMNDLLNLDYIGLVISRTPKKDLLRLINGPFEHLWLGEQIEGEALFMKILTSIGEMKGKGVIMIDRLDYLVFKYGFKETLGFIFKLRDQIYLREQVAIISIDPSTLKEDELNIMQKEMSEIELRQIPRPGEELMEIAQLIYDKNSAGIKPSFSEIGEELSLSKPTFRKRVRRLISSGYAVEVTKGNRKVLELTQKGRSLFFK